MGESPSATYPGIEGLGWGIESVDDVQTRHVQAQFLHFCKHLSPFLGCEVGLKMDGALVVAAHPRQPREDASAYLRGGLGQADVDESSESTTNGSTAAASSSHAASLIST